MNAGWADEIVGARREIGREISLRAARDGANVALLARCVTEGKLEGLLYTVAEEVTDAGGEPLIIGVDLRDDEAVLEAIGPRKTVETVATARIGGDGDDLLTRSRKPSIMADAFHATVTKPSRECTCQFFLNEDVLRESGVMDFSPDANSASETVYLVGGDDAKYYPIDHGAMG